jgi:uncharacterized protein
MIAIFDCMIYLQAASHPHGSAAKCLELVLDRKVQLLWSEEIESEVREVFSRPKILRKLPVLTPEYINDFLDMVDLLATKVDFVPTLFQLPRDPKDEKYLNLAISSHAKYLVSRDNDLLDLMTDKDELSLAFRHDYPSVEILIPETFLANFNNTLPGDGTI